MRQWMALCSICLALILTLCSCATILPDSTMEPTGMVTASPLITAVPTLGPTLNPTPTPYVAPEAYTIEKFPIVYQKPELPTGCEITALTMMLQYYGYDVDKITMAKDYLPTLPRETKKGEDGKLYGPDLYHYFVGDPTKYSGTICGAGAVQAAANKYLMDVVSGMQAIDITGVAVSTLYEYVSQGTPVFVCATVDMQDRRAFEESWYTEDGDIMEWARGDHGLVLIGYTSDTVIIGDPLAGQISYSREQFEKVYQQRGCQAVVLQGTREVPAATPATTPTVTPAPAGHEISGFPIVYQNPELPTGCEITALTMVLNYYGHDVDKMTMAKEHLPIIRYLKTYQGQDGKKYGSDLYNNFIGDPTRADSGITCGAGAIQIAANSYLSEVESPLRAQDITGTPVEELYAYIDNNIPVFVCTTISMQNRKEIRNSWYTEEGRYVDWTGNDHGSVLIGYSQEKVTIADPISGIVTFSRKQFEKVYEQRGRQAVVLKDNL